MTRKQSEESFSERETIARREAALRRLLTTQRRAIFTTRFRYLKAIRSVRLSVEALSFKGSFAAFSLC